MAKKTKKVKYAYLITLALVGIVGGFLMNSGGIYKSPSLTLIEAAPNGAVTGIYKNGEVKLT